MLGENGTGKSTLGKTLSGVVSQDQGTMKLAVNDYRPHSIVAARDHGIATAPRLARPAVDGFGRQLKNVKTLTVETVIYKFLNLHRFCQPTSFNNFGVISHDSLP